MSDLQEVIALIRTLNAKATQGPWETDGRHIVTSNELGWITGHVADAGEQDVDLIVTVRNHLTRLLDAAEAGATARDAALEEAAKAAIEAVADCTELGAIRARRVGAYVAAFIRNLKTRTA